MIKGSRHRGGVRFHETDGPGSPLDQIVEALCYMESDQHIGKVVGVIAVMLLLRSAALAEIHSGVPGEPARGAAATALALCCEADRLSGAERQRALMRGLELAQDAAAVDPSDARAHFAVFCNLGKQVQSRALGLRDLGAIGRLRHELDTALELAPDDGEALTAKGAMLPTLPWFLGGDVRRGEELLRTVLIKDPTNAAARRYLTEALRSRGADDEAHALEMLDTPTAAPEAVCARFARDVALPLDGGLSCRDVLPRRCRKNGGKTE